MTYFCTYCSKDKDASKGDMPAIQRYQSTRIKSVYSAAKSLGFRFIIFSGEFGLLEPHDPIPYYDHLLLSPEVSEHSKLVANQLDSLGVKELIFFTRNAPIVKPYRDCIKIACNSADVEIKYIYLDNDA
jgi:hypothetical protein